MRTETMCQCGKDKAWDEQYCPECQDNPEIDRRLFIGGSDISSVAGISRWKTPLQLYCEKAGLVEPDDLSGNEAVELGIELEDFVAKKFERITQMKVRRAPKRYVHKEYPFLACQVDRLVTNSDWLPTASLYLPAAPRKSLLAYSLLPSFYAFIALICPNWLHPASATPIPAIRARYAPAYRILIMSPCGAVVVPKSFRYKRLQFPLRVGREDREYSPVH